MEVNFRHVGKQVKNGMRNLPHNLRYSQRYFAKRIHSIMNPQGEMAVSRSNIASSNYSAGIANNIIGGNFFTGLLLLMKADDAFIGTITMAIFLGNILQILSPMLLERFPYRKKLLISARVVIYVLNIIVITIIPFLNFTNGLKLMMVLLTVLMINFINAVTAPGFSVWHIKSIPENVRASYFSFFSIVNGVLIYTLVLIGSKVVDHLKANGSEMTGLLIIRIIALGFAIADIFFLFKIKEYPNTSVMGSTNLKNIFLGPFKHKKYLITVAIGFLWAFAANIPGPYFSVYLLKDLKMQYSVINLINMLNIPILIFATPLWSKMIKKTSWFKTLCFCMSILIVHYLGLAFVTNTTLFLYPIFLFVAFIMLTGINLTFSNIPFVNIPEENQTSFIGFFAAMSNLAAFLGVTLGREFITRTEEIRLNIFGMVLQNKQYILLFTACIMVIATVTIYVLQKKVEEQ